MSFERAYKNCKICYLNAKSNSRDYRANELLLDSDIERSMNESMKALEGVIQQIFPFWTEAIYREPEQSNCYQADFKDSPITNIYFKAPIKLNTKFFLIFAKQAVHCIKMRL